MTTAEKEWLAAQRRERDALTHVVNAQMVWRQAMNDAADAWQRLTVAERGRIDARG